MVVNRVPWMASWGAYKWTVNLSKYAAAYSGYFVDTISAKNVTCFESRFREAVDSRGPYQIAGEVCYWKNAGNHLSRDRITSALLDHLSDKPKWNAFCVAVRQVCASPSLDAFRRVQEVTGQSDGFATPLTFVSFYNPASFPMVDKHIACWWAANRDRFGLAEKPAFVQRKDGWIDVTSQAKAEQNWNAYMAWTGFCRDYAHRLGDWRARDVEMAVWMAQKDGTNLPVLETR